MNQPAPRVSPYLIGHKIVNFFCIFFLPPLRFFLWRLCRQQAINRILMSTNPVPDEIPISIKRPLDVFINGLPVPVVSVCWVVNTDNDNCGATVRFIFAMFVVLRLLIIIIFFYYFFNEFFKSSRARKNHFLCAINKIFCVCRSMRPWIILLMLNQ